MLTAVCATSTTMVGSANFVSVGRIGPLSSAARVVSRRGRARASRVAAAPVVSDGACAAWPAGGMVASSSAMVCVLSRVVRPAVCCCITIIMHYYDRNAICTLPGHDEVVMMMWLMARAGRRDAMAGQKDALRKGTQGSHPAADHRGRIRPVSCAWRRRGGPRRHHDGGGADQRRLLRTFLLQGGSGPGRTLQCAEPARADASHRRRERQRARSLDPRLSV